MQARADFAFESTLSGLAYASRIKEWKTSGYRVEIYFVGLSSVELALRRIAARVKQGGHDVPRQDVLRRFDRSLKNFENVYRPLAHRWLVYDNSEESTRLIEEGP